MPAPAALRADPDASSEREWLLTAAVVGALVELAGPGPPPAPTTSNSQRASSPAASSSSPSPTAGFDAELVALAFEEHAAGIDRLRARALALPPGVIDDVPLKTPIGARHPLRIAEAVARLGGKPAGAHDDLEDAMLAVLGPGGGSTRPHEDPDPAKRAARRILQRLDGMGKWGGYHTEFAHLAARLRRQRPRARADGGGGPAGGRPAGREAVRRPAPRLPQPAQGGRDPQADRDGRRSHRV